jgi:hypothetical protein
MTTYVNRQIKVCLDTSTDPASISFSENPHIPREGIGTITWIVDPEGDAFTFKDFSWCNDKNFLHKPIIEPEVMVTAVNNQERDYKGHWGYRIHVKPTSGGSKVGSMKCKDIPTQAQQEAASISAAMVSGPVIINDGV